MLYYITMFKRLLIILFILALNIFSGGVFAAEAVKINSVTFDNSDNMIFIGSLTTLPSETSLKLVKLSNPDRVYFDIENAILTRPNTSWSFKNSLIRQVKVSQFSTDPNTVRVVVYTNSSFDLNKIKLLKIGNSFVFSYKNEFAKQDFMTNIYREQKSSSDDYYEYTSFSEDPKDAKTTEEPAAPSYVRPNNETISKIDGAFKQPETAQTSRVERKFKLKSKFYVNQIDVKRGNALIRGMGQIAIENPIILTSPTRLVFDMPNTYVDPDLRNKEFVLSEKETIKIGQFEPTKARVVITTEDVSKFRPIYSFDGQSIFLANDDRILGIKLYDQCTSMGNFVAKKQSDQVDIFQTGLSAPPIHSIKRYNNRLELMLYNITGFNQEAFKQVLQSDKLSQLKAEKINQVGTKLTLPLKNTDFVEYNESFDNRELQLIVTSPKETEIKPSGPIFKRNTNIKTIVIDAGHGGSDVGATRECIYEKDINLDVAKKIANILTNKGYNVEMTRRTDDFVSLQDRVIFTDQRKADLFVSVHVNSSVKSEASGVETHYYTDGSYDFAQAVHRQLACAIKTPDRGLFKSKFYVINNSIAPSILVEIGFISNDQERCELLTEARKKKTAEAIADGIMKYVKK